MNIQSDDLTREQAHTAKLIADLEYKKPPHDFTARVMQSITPIPKPASSPISNSVSNSVSNLWWHRAISWLLTPRMIRIPPLVPVTALAGVILLIIVLSNGIFMKQYTAPGVDAGPELVGQTDSSGQQVINVVFTVNVNDAREVALIGSFNNWQGQDHKLTPSDEAGKWTISVPLEQGLHEYAFVVDGVRIIPDPVSLVYKDDGFGNLNSVILVEDYEQT